MFVRRHAARAAAVAAAGALVAGAIAFSAPASGAPNVRPQAYQYGNWSAVGSGFSGNSSNIVYRLLRDSSQSLIAAGTFRKSGDDTVNRIAKFNGTSWGNLAVDDSGISPGVATTLNPNGDWPGVFGAKINGDDSIYIAGTFQFADDDTVNNVARWTGSGWQRMGVGLQTRDDTYPLQDMVIGRDPTAAFDTNYADDTIFAVGGVTGVCPTLNSCPASSSSNYWGVAQYSQVDDTWSALSPARFSGMPITGAYLDDTTATDDTVIVAGEFTTIGGATFNRIAAFSYADDTWHQLGTGNFGFNNAVYAATVHPVSGDLYVAGKFTALCTNAACSTTTDISDGVAKWDRQTGEWYSVGSGMTAPNLDDIGFSPNGNVMYVSGFNNTAVGSLTNGIATLAGGDFSAAATNVGGAWNYIKSAGYIGLQSGAGGRSLIVNNDGSVYVAGNFTQAGAVAVANVALFTPGTEPSPYDPVYPPGAPTDVVAVGDWNKVTVSWKVPTYTGSYPITNYLVTASPSNRVCITSLRDTKLTECTFTSLTPGTNYTFTVQGLNGGGWGEESASSNVASPQNLKVTSYSRKKRSFFVGGGSEIKVGGIAPGFTKGTRITPWLKIGDGEWVEGVNSRLKVDSSGKFSWGRKLSKGKNSSKVTVRFSIAGNYSNTVAIPRVR